MAGLSVEQVRAEFPLTGACVYLDTAYRGPFPARSARAMQDYAERYSARPFPDGRQEQRLERIEAIRVKVARLLGVAAEEIWFAKSTTDAQSIVANALLKPGDEILVGGLDHPANYTVWAHLANRGVSVKVVPHRGGHIEADDLAAAIGPRTRALGLCLVNTYNGYRQDIDALCRLAGDRELYLLLDGIQAMGHLDIDLGSGRVTLLAAGAYKWLCSPEGLGVAYVNRRVIEKIIPETLHFYGIDPRGGAGWRAFIEDAFELGYAGAKPREITPGLVDLPPDTRRLEAPVSLLALTGLEGMVDLLAEFGGMTAVERRVLGLSARLRAALQEHGHRVLSDPDPARASGITSVQVADSNAFGDYCRRRGIHVLPQLPTAPGAQAVRVSTHFFNNEDDIAAFTEAMDAYRDSR